MGSAFRTPDSELWTLDSELWILDSELWNLDSELRTPNSGLRTPDSGLTFGHWTLRGSTEKFGDKVKILFLCIVKHHEASGEEIETDGSSFFCKHLQIRPKSKVKPIKH